MTVADADVAVGLVADSGGEIVARSPTALFWRRFRQDRVAVASLVFVIFVIVVAIAAPLVVKLLGLPGPYVQNLNLTNAFGEPIGTDRRAPLRRRRARARTSLHESSTERGPRSRWD